LEKEKRPSNRPNAKKKTKTQHQRPLLVLSVGFWFENLLWNRA